MSRLFTVTREENDYETLHGPQGFECALTEPEDRTFSRDLAPVVELLERLTKENEQFRKLINAVQPAHESWQSDEFHSVDGKGWFNLREELTGVKYWQYVKDGELKKTF